MMPWFNWMHGYGWGGLGWVGWILNLVITLGVIVGIVLLVLWLVRRAGSGNPGFSQTNPAQSQPTPREILQIRYARGEISREEFQQMLSDIG